MYIYPHMFPAGPDTASVQIDSHFNLCPSTSQPIEINCSLDYVTPFADVTITMVTPDTTHEAQCVPVSRTQCTHRFMPTTGGTHRFQCSAVNSVDSSYNATSPVQEVHVIGKQQNIVQVIVNRNNYRSVGIFHLLLTI